ncbi:MAG: hypothetical protein JOY61_12185, partial [Chloroflexi bacterium]|nr:hypothetical protein [Chloroflexota bacterium]
MRTPNPASGRGPPCPARRAACVASRWCAAWRYWRIRRAASEKSARLGVLSGRSDAVRLYAVAALPRLNGAIRALEQGDPAFVTFSPAEVGNAQAIGDAAYDAVVFEMEHNPYDIRALRDCLQYLLNRRQIVDSGSLAPAVAPFVRIPPNGGELNQWVAKQVLDSGVYGVVWPHVSTVEDARNAVAACRYPRPRTAANFEPAGQRGDAPAAAARYWGLSQQDYYARADVWPLASDGELLVVIMCEEARAIG